jgi:hypothetical protein
LLAFLLFAGFGAVVGAGGMVAINYSETSGFCGKCHTMDPELKAYSISAHKDVACAECHVEPGVKGWVKAKVKGTKQLYDVITSNVPKPILPPDHAELPSVKDTCMKCHSLDRITANGGPIKIVMRPQYKLDEANTREMVAVVIRPGGQGSTGLGEGVHWHIAENVTYTSSDIHSKTIDFVQVNFKNGTQDQFIAASEIGAPNNVLPDITRLKKAERTRLMDCIDCHNRVGHSAPSPEKAVDEAMANGSISPILPYIKRDAVGILNGNYPNLASADKAIAALKQNYESEYPLLLRTSETQVDTAIEKLKVIYRLVATPTMKVQSNTYADNLGHQSSPGCFRCHDGAHFKVVKGQITTETIPSTCATCHTFPQVGAKVSDVLVGSKPASHQDKLYVFNHKSAVSSVLPAGTTCGACHTKTYCENCHNSGAIKVTHGEMLYNHVAVIAKAGSTKPCAFCHQAVYCARCHETQVLKSPHPPASKTGI